MKPRDIPQLLLEWFLGTIGVAGSLLCLSTAFSLRMPSGLFLFTAGLMLLFCLLFRLRRGGVYAIAVGAALLLLCLFFRHALKNGILRLWYVLADSYEQGYNLKILQHDEPGDPRGVGHVPAIVALAVLETYVSALAISRWKQTLPCALALLLGVAPCFILTDTPPMGLALVWVLFSVATLALSQNARRRAGAEATRAMLWSSGAAALALLLLLVLFPRVSYSPPLRWEKLDDKLQVLTEPIGRKMGISEDLPGNPSAVNLNGLGRLPGSPGIVMNVNTEYKGLLYLRGSSYSDFDGSRWLRDTSERWELEDVFPCYHMPWVDENYLMTVYPLVSDGICYTTYEVRSLPEHAQLVGDSYIMYSGGRKSYTMRFVGEDAMRRAANEDYSDWVRKTCLSLPDETREGLLEWWRREPLAVSATEAIPREVAKRVSVLASYSRNPDPVPPGCDFCTWFVNEAREGYCVHYATVATAMLRALGIPARFVTGYVCRANGGTTAVTNMDGHAWTEYYLDGSWHRLEATPADATEFTGRRGGFVVKDKDLPIPSAPPTEPPTAPPLESTEEPVESDVPATTAPKTTDPDTGKTQPSARPEQWNDAPEREAAKRFVFHGWLWIPVALFAALLLIVLRRRLCGKLRARKLAAAETNDGAMLLWRRYRKLCRLGRRKPSTEAKRLAERACFSQHELTPEELSVLRQCLDEQISRLNGAGLMKRLYYRYVLAVI